MLILKRAFLFKPRFITVATISSSCSSYINHHITKILSNQIQTSESLHKHTTLIITSGNSNNIFIASKLISSYASQQKPNISAKIFNSVTFKDVFLWNSIIKAYFSNGDYPQALDYFFSMVISGESSINHFTVPMVVSSSAELLWFDVGRFIHGLVLKRNCVVGASFVYFYSKCGSLKDACQVFEEMPERDVVAWTSIISGHIQNGESQKGLEYLCKMMHSDEKPNSRTFECGFQACVNLEALNEGKCLHGFSVKTGLASSSSIFSLYTKCGNKDNLSEAYRSFCELDDDDGKDMFSWTSIIGFLAKSGKIEESFDMFWEMQRKGIEIDEVVISCLINELGTRVADGKAFHGFVIRRCYKVNISLLSMYCKFELLSMAEKLFFSEEEGRNNEAWNVMVKGYSKTKRDAECIELFRKILKLGIEIDSGSLASVVSSCSRIGAGLLGKSLHCYVVKTSFDLSVSVVNSLIDLYGKIGDLSVAWRLFVEAEKNVVTWNAMIACYVHCQQSEKAIALFDRMDLKPNLITLVTVLTACANTGSLEKGEAIHRYITETEEEMMMNVSVVTALIDMYAKCGELEKSWELFNSAVRKDAVCWNVMISGYGMHGDFKSAIELFDEMEEEEEVKPTGTTFLAVLSACVHAGLVEKGKKLFLKMVNQYGVKPDLKHYSCLVDLLSRSGYLREAEIAVNSMPFSPDGVIWGTLLSSCMTHEEFEMGIRMAERAVASDPRNDGYRIMLANMYSAAGKWEDAEKAREVMRECGIEKRAGHSVV